MGDILPRNCFVKYVMKGKTDGRIEIMRRQEKRRKQLLNELKEKRER
jgi:hypothetical protein